LTAGQKEFLRLEPILVTVRLESGRLAGIPPAPGKSKQGALRFEIEPAVKLRPGAKPLPLEGQTADANVTTRNYDLFECFAFPEQGGPWTVRAVFEHRTVKMTSASIAITISRPGKDDAEQQPMARLHHTPWSNYTTNAFCGDTFDLVQRWPKSRFVKYCHYWNGRYFQHKKEYDKAIASFRIVIEKYPDFVLADASAFGIVECLCAQKKLQEAQKHNTALRQKIKERAVKAGLKPGTGRTSVERLAQDMGLRLTRDLGLE
jgi:hypothetical protein